MNAEEQRAHETALLMGFDAMRICMNMDPVHFPHDEVVQWMNNLRRAEQHALPQDSLGGKEPQAPLPAGSASQNDDERWMEIQGMSHEIANSSRVPSRIESALCGAVVRAREAMRDAARYRWLRDASAEQYDHPIAVTQTRSDVGMRYVGPVLGKVLDDAIDAAIAERER